jgi:hypothetical protein
MKYVMLICGLVLASCAVQAQDFEWYKTIKNVKGSIKVLSEDLVVIITDADPNERYISRQLPDSLKKDGLKVTFTGEVGKIPPNFRMAGTPLKLHSIKVSCAEAKKYGLKVKKYKF